MSTAAVNLCDRGGRRGVTCRSESDRRVLKLS
jgi:hypothetical protein